MSFDEWKEYKLRDVSTILTGFPFKGNKYSDNGIRVLRGENVTIGNLRWDTIKCWNEPFQQVEKYSLKPGDIVIGMDGSRVGKNRAQIRSEELPLLLAQRVACVRSNKLSNDFQYLWVAEKQTENKVFKDNIHFHLITNKYWKIDKWWPYWLTLQAKRGIVPRDENFKPSSAFDVKSVNGNNVKGIANYLTHYVTKNEGQFFCQIWNCSKKISRLYTDLYSDMSFLKQVEALEAQNLLGGERKVYKQEYCHVHTIPLNRITLNLYSKIDQKNKEVWNAL